MKKTLKLAHLLERESTKIIFMIGLSFTFMFAVLGYAYLRGDATGGLLMDITTVATGTMAYVWIGLMFVWLTTKAVRYLLRFRNWWTHTEDHRIKLLPTRR